MSIFNVSINLPGCCGGHGGEEADPLGLGDGIRSGLRRESETCVSLLWNLTLGGLANLLCLCSNAGRLEEDVKKLRAVNKDIARRLDVAQAQTPPLGCLRQAEEWVEEVKSLETHVSEFFDSLRSRTAYLRVLCLSYTAADLLKQVAELRTKRDEFKELDGLALPPPVVRVSLSGTTISPGDPTLSAVLQLLKDDGVGLLGIRGKPLVGKTTLLQAVNNELLRPGGVDTFDVVIWVTVPSNPDGSPDIRKIQEEIGHRLGLALLEADDPARALCHVLSRRRFLLLLDDVWETLALEKIGIPHPTSENKCKVVFATRRGDVCVAMGATEVPLNGLTDEQSWELFRANLGLVAAEELDKSPQVLHVAKRVVAQCGGLPIAVVTVGRAMAGKSLLPEWRHALWALEDSAVEVQGMESILSSVKFSYDHLRDDALRNCLLYCSLFPGGCDIDREQLVEYWVGEGFLDDMGNNSDNIDIARGRGYFNIRDLEDAYLLSSGSSNSAGKKVRLPEPVHDLALWLTGDHRLNGRDRFVVLAGKGSVEVRGVENWSNAERVSLMKNKIERLPQELPKCPHLLTLLINDNPPLAFEKANKNQLCCSETTLYFEGARDTNCITGKGNPVGKGNHPNGILQQVYSQDATAADYSILASQPLPCKKKKKSKAKAFTTSQSSSSTVTTTTTTTTTPTLSTTTTSSSSSSTIAPNMHVESCRKGSTSLFQFMTCLQVLDLSFTSIDHLPSDIELLTELQYLNLSCTKIKSLPRGLGNLVKLRQLDLRATKHLSAIPHETISKLQRLQMLNLYDGAYYLCCGDNQSSQSWECLAALGKLDELGLNIKTSLPLQTPPKFRRFWTCTRFLTIEGMPGSASEIQHLETLKWEDGQFLDLKALKLLNLPLSTVMWGCPGPLAGLQSLNLSGCSEMKDIGWALKLQCLEEIDVRHCERMEVVLIEEGNDGYSSLPKLRKIHVEDLPQLRAISRSPALKFPCLVELNAKGCPKLSNPPLEGAAAPKLKLFI